MVEHICVPTNLVIATNNNENIKEKWIPQWFDFDFKTPVFEFANLRHEFTIILNLRPPSNFQVKFGKKYTLSSKVLANFQFHPQYFNFYNAPL